MNYELGLKYFRICNVLQMFLDRGYNVEHNFVFQNQNFRIDFGKGIYVELSCL